MKLKHKHTKRTALSMSQSEKMIKGDFPPSSSDVFFKLEFAQERITIFPVSVLPVKPSFRTTGCSASAWPITLPACHLCISTLRLCFNSRIPLPVTMLMTPGGMPARAASSANFKAVNGHTSAGLWTTVFPAAKQAAIFHESIING